MSPPPSSRRVNVRALYKLLAALWAGVAIASAAVLLHVPAGALLAGGLVGVPACLIGMRGEYSALEDAING